VSLGGVSDPDGDEVSYEIQSVTQDEPVFRGPDARLALPANGVWLRAERLGRGDGRVYRIEYTASDGQDGSCVGTAVVQVPHDAAHPVARDSGLWLNSFF
jgi:hypothetical protein